MSKSNVIDLAERRKAKAAADPDQIIARDTFGAPKNSTGVAVEVTVFRDGATMIKQGEAMLGLRPRQALRLERLLRAARKAGGGGIR